jgi:hypothetical protein
VVPIATFNPAEMQRSGGYWNQPCDDPDKHLVDLHRVLAAPESISGLRHLVKRLAALKASGAKPRAITSQRQRPHRPGWVVNAVVRVLTDEDGPMRRQQVHAAVEQLLGQAVSKDSVDWCLSSGVRRKTPQFERISPGCYRLIRTVEGVPR